MKFKTILIFIIITALNSCGKKTYLEKYENVDYPKQYPVD